MVKRNPDGSVTCPNCKKQYFPVLGERRAGLRRYAPLERKLKTIQDKLVMGATFDQNGNLKKGQ